MCERIQGWRQRERECSIGKRIITIRNNPHSVKLCIEAFRYLIQHTRLIMSYSNTSVEEEVEEEKLRLKESKCIVRARPEKINGQYCCCWTAFVSPSNDVLFCRLLR